MFDEHPRMIPSIKNGDTTEDLNFFSQLQRKSNSGFDPCTFFDIALIIFDTDEAANILDILDKKRVADAWKKANQRKILLDATKEYRGTPVKSRPTKVTPVAAERTSVMRLPGEEDEGKELVHSGEEEDSTTKDMMDMIRQIDWKKVKFEVPSAKINKN